MRYEIQLLPQGAIGHDVGLEIPLAGKGVAPEAPPCPPCPEGVTCPDPSVIAICPNPDDVIVGNVTEIAVAFTTPLDHDVTVTVTGPGAATLAFFDPIASTFSADSAVAVFTAGGVGQSFPALAVAQSDECDISVDTGGDPIGTSSCNFPIQCGTNVQDIWIGMAAFTQDNVSSAGATFFRDGSGENAGQDLISSTLPSSAALLTTTMVQIYAKVQVPGLCPDDALTWDTAGSTCDTSFISISYPFPVAGGSGTGNGDIAIIQVDYAAAFPGSPDRNDGETLIINAYLNGTAITARRGTFEFDFVDTFWG